MTRTNILIGCTGSVATVKLPELVVKTVSAYSSLECNENAHEIGIKVVFTKSASHFLTISQDYNSEYFSQFLKLLNQESMKKLEKLMAKKLISDGDSVGNVEILFDEDEWKDYKSVQKDEVLHIELRKWADVLVVAPLSANSLAKYSNGLCDDLLSCIVRAWDFNKPMILCPSMNTFMFEHPLTRQQLETLKSFSPLISILDPQSKKLACGDIGKGAMASVENIISALSGKILTKL